MTAAAAAKPEDPIKVMLIDDDEGVHEAVQSIVEKAGYEFRAAFDGESGLEMLTAEKPDVLLLDVMMPGMNGFDVCRTMREQGRRIPVVFLSAKGDIVDKSIGFKAGGDDYVVKPFSSAELLLRIEAHVRRHRDDLMHTKSSEPEESIRCAGDLEIFYDRYEVRLRGEKVPLTAKEFEILALLSRAPGRVFTRSQIYEHIWGTENAPDESSITVFMRKIREKIEDNPSRPKYLLTVWRVGYKFVEED